MRITVLGTSPSWQNAGGACSGYLVEEGGTTLLIDCGNGVFGRLRTHRDYLDVDAVAISHLHADHFIDLVPYSYALTYAPRQQPVAVDGWPGTSNPVSPRLIAPEGAAAVFARVVGAWGNDDLIEHAFELESYEPGGEVVVGDLRLRFCAVPHFVVTCAIEVRSESTGRRFTFGADCAPNDELVAFAEGTDLLMIEATLPRPERAGPRGHLTAAEAGDHARRAGVGRVAIVHVSDELDRDRVRSEAERAFGGPVTIAAIDDCYELT